MDPPSMGGPHTKQRREGIGHRVVPRFFQSYKINMAAVVGVHLGNTSASLAIHKVGNTFLVNYLPTLIFNGNFGLTSVLFIKGWRNGNRSE